MTFNSVEPADKRFSGDRESARKENAFFMEALILYFVLFFPGIFVSPFTANTIPAETIPFSALRELGRTLTYTLPSLALLWYLMSDKKGFSALREEKFYKRDLHSFSIGLPGLIIIGLVISFVIARLPDFVLPPRVEAPAGIAGWITVIFACLCTGYLEESYFRYYLLEKLENSVPPPALRIAFSTVLFSVCHMYEGPGGIVNSVLAGVLLSVLFIRYRSLHGIAWAHAGYNLFVYIMGVFV